MNFEIYTTNLKQAIQTKKERYIVNSIAKAEQQQAQLAVADIGALKRDLPRLKKENQRIYNTKVEDKLSNILRGPFNFELAASVLNTQANQ